MLNVAVGTINEYKAEKVGCANTAMAYADRDHRLLLHWKPLEALRPWSFVKAPMQRAVMAKQRQSRLMRSYREQKPPICAI